MEIALKPKIACVIVPHFAVAVERRADDSLMGKPIVVGGMPCEKGKVYDLSEEAAMSGVERGIALRQAEELCPEAVFLPLAEEKYLRAFEELLEVLQSFSPDVEPKGLGKACLEVSGLEALHGDDARLCRTIGLAVREETRLEATFEDFGDGEDQALRIGYLGSGEVQILGEAPRPPQENLAHASSPFED